MSAIVVVSERIAPLTSWECSISERASAAVVCRPLGSHSQIAENARDAPVVMIGAVEPFDEQALSTLPELKLIARRGVGIDNIDVEAASRRRVLVTNVPAASVDEVSDHALTLILALLRRIVPAHQGFRNSRLNLARAAVDAALPFSETALGVVGAGRIGRRLVTKCRGLFASVYVADPYVSEVDGAEVLPLHELLSRCDAISLHVPLDEQTRGMLDARLLDITRPGAVVVNTSRSGVLDEVALAARVRSGHIGGVGLDVTDQESLWHDLIAEGFDNVLLTGHTGARGTRSQERLRRTCADQVVDFLNGRMPDHVVHHEHKGQ